MTLPRGWQDETVQLDAVADELYGLPLEQFVPTRALRAKQARDAGDKQLAADIRALAKPNLVAWLVNQLAREDAGTVQSLLTLGSRFRRATANPSGEVIRELSKEQRELVAGLLRRADGHAGAVGRKVTGETARSLEETLRSALADEAAAELVGAGRLTGGLQATGFGGTGLPSGRTGRAKGGTGRAKGGPSPEETGPTGTGRRSGGTRPGTDRARREPRHRAEQAAEAVRRADEAQREARRKLEQADRVAADTGRRVEQLRRQLREALDAQSTATKEQRRARTEHARADRAAEAARRRRGELPHP